jgi:hypothetical protein
MDGVTFVRIMAIAATHFAFQDRMMAGQMKLASFIEVTLKTGLRVPARVDDRVASPSAFGVNATRPMA